MEKELRIANRKIDLYRRYIRYVTSMIGQNEMPITFEEWSNP